MAIVVDVTFAIDHPGVEKKEYGEAAIDGGPVLTRGSIISPVVFNLLRKTAEDGRFRLPSTPRAAKPAPMPTRFTSRAKESRPDSYRFPTATCIRPTRS